MEARFAEVLDRIRGVLRPAPRSDTEPEHEHKQEDGAEAS
jgi:hypothetical protein